VTGAPLLIRCLEREGVRYVLGLPGEETLDLNDALLDSPIRFVPVRHEPGAAFMADVWGRLTGRAGVRLGTLGRGATNRTTGLADANLDRAPVVAISGQLARGLLHKEARQIRWKQLKRFGLAAGVYLGNPDRVALAEAFGRRGVRATSAAGLRSALAGAFAFPVPALVNCPVDYAEYDRLAEL
jgi:thiamine pyrophosphate-dependent acetolactate synthase large subunit-like protein